MPPGFRFHPANANDTRPALQRWGRRSLNSQQDADHAKSIGQNDEGKIIGRSFFEIILPSSFCPHAGRRLLERQIESVLRAI